MMIAMPIALLFALAAAVHAEPAPSAKKAAASAVSDDARRRLMRGRAAMKDAKDAAGFLDAAKEFEAASAAAPGMPEPLYNAGVAYEKAGDPASALKQFKAYLEAAPKAKDAQAVKDRIFELEYRAEKASDLSGCWQSDSWQKSDEDMLRLYGPDWCEFVIERDAKGGFSVRPHKERHTLYSTGRAPNTNLHYYLRDISIDGGKVRLTRMVQAQPESNLSINEYDLTLSADGTKLSGRVRSRNAFFKHSGEGTTTLIRYKK